MLLAIFVMTLIIEEAEARRRRGRGGVRRQGGAARVQARRGPRRAARPRVVRNRGFLEAPSFANVNNNNLQDLVDFGPASRIAPDLFGGIGGFGNFGGFGGFGGLGGFGGFGSGFGSIVNPVVANPAASSLGGLQDLRLLQGFPNLATNARGDFFEIDPRLLAQGRNVGQAVVQPLVGANGRIITGMNGDVSAATLGQIRAFNQGEIPVAAAGGRPVAIGVVSVRRR
jgi:hypothetical protein